VVRTEDARLLRGDAGYLADLDFPGAAFVAFVTSSAAHARIVSLDVEQARRMPGVLDVLSAAEVDVGPFPPVGNLPPAMRRSLLAADVVRFVGEALVAIVSETASAGADAAEAVVVDLDPLPPVIGVDAALSGAALLFPEAGTNVVTVAEGGSGDVSVEGCEVVVRATMRNQRLAPCPLETRAAASQWSESGRLTHWSSCQGVHPVRAVLCQLYGLPAEQVRVIVPDVGGSFGAKARPSPEEVLLPLLAARTGRTVRWVPPRSQDMVGMGHSRAQLQHVALGGRLDGTIEALHLQVDADVGAYPVAGPLLALNTANLASGAYRMERVRWRTRSVVTTTTPIGAYRGAGRPEAAAAVERAVDLFAAELGVDPVEVRRRNLLRPEDFPYRSPTGLTYDSGSYQRCLDAALAAVDYQGLRLEQHARREAGDRQLLGVGLATFVDRTAGVAGTEFGAVELRPDATVVVRTGSSPYGQGHHTSWAMLVSDRTGISMDRIEVVHGDTDVVPRGGITGGSRSVQRAGSAVAVAADELVARAREVAADLLEAAVDDVVLELAAGGRFHVAGAPARAVRWKDVASATVDPLSCEADVEGPPTFPFGAYVAVVEVDRGTGHTALRRMVTVDDAGRILNPLLAEGQVHGGVAQGIAQALLEEFSYDVDGNPLTSNFADYPVISATELPFFECALIETPSPNNPLGAKGIGESGTIGAPPAVQNAVVDALSHLGIRHIDMPCTPERVWRALHDVGADLGA
jgi:carbon-monoxide dehydrogenase large subunit